MIALLWKDWRLVRPLLIAAAVLYLMPWPISGAIVAFGGGEVPGSGEEWLATASVMCSFGLLTSFLATPMFPAVMFARERRDRTAELAATMPVSRRRIVASKAIVSIAAASALSLLTLALVPLMVLLGGAPAQQQWGSGPAEALPSVFIPLANLAMPFAVAWFFSALLKSETAAAGIAYLVAIGVPVVSALILQRLYSSTIAPYYLIPGAIAVGAFAAGTVVALRRVSP